MHSNDPSKRAAETSEELKTLRAHSVNYSGNTESIARCFFDDNSSCNLACKIMHQSLQVYSPEGQDH